MKKTVSLLLAILMAFSLSSLCFATTLEKDGSLSNGSEDIVSRAEETMWYYRQLSGAWQRRLWSITHNKWLTDWIIL